jgi:hypothetical protein
MKIVISFWAKLFVLLILHELILTSKIGFGLFKKSETHTKETTKLEKGILDDYLSPNATKKNPDLPDLPYYYEGWIKYLHYAEGDKRQAKAFWKNTAYEEQVRNGISGAALIERDNVINKKVIIRVDL